jgi:hypothetical protein
MAGRPQVTVSVLVCRAALVLALVMLAAARPGVAAASKWTYASSEHFDIYTTAGEKRAREALVYFERVHAFFADFLKLEPKPLHPTRLIVYSNAREYEPVKVNDVAAAYYAGGPDRDYIVMRSFDSESYPLVVHEYAHLIARHSGAAYPPWLNEGLAEFFSTLVPEAGQMSIGKVPRGRLRELVNGGLMDLNRLLAVTHGSPEYSWQDHVGTFYAQSWALTHMIVTSDAYRAKSGTFVASVGRGVPAADAFQSIYGKTIANVFADLGFYIRGQHFLYFTAKYRDPKAAATASARAATDFEAALVTANLLAERLGKAGEARAMYEKLALEQPNDVSLLEARALLELRDGRSDLAKELLSKAVAAGSRNPKIYRWAASFADSSDVRARLLEKALALDPNDLDMRLAFASALLAKPDRDAALRVLEPVKVIAPEQAFMYFQLMANIAMQNNEIADARRAAARARQAAVGTSQTEYADRLLQSIDAYIASRAAADRAEREFVVATNRPPASDAPSTTAAGTLETSTLTGEVLTVLSGRIKLFDCRGASPIVEVATDAGSLRLLVDDPLKIQVVGSEGPSVDITCGPQDKMARIGYAPGPNTATQTTGAVRLLDLR